MEGFIGLLTLSAMEPISLFNFQKARQQLECREHKSHSAYPTKHVVERQIKSYFAFSIAAFEMSSSKVVPSDKELIEIRLRSEVELLTTCT